MSIGQDYLQVAQKLLPLERFRAAGRSRGYCEKDRKYSVLGIAQPLVTVPIGGFQILPIL